MHVRTLAWRAGFALCLGLGRLLRSARYAKAWIAQDRERQVRKRRLFYAPFLIWVANGVMRLLDTGVLVLSQQEWEQRERRMYWSLYGAPIRVDAGRTLVLPHLAGQTLAAVLENPALAEPVRKRAIELAVTALAAFHHLGFSHGDAMADNVLVDLDSGIARWFDFETIHDPKRPMLWCRADDVRALLATSLARTSPGKFRETTDLILTTYGDESVLSTLATRFTVSRPLPFHLAQAPLPFHSHAAIVRMLKERDTLRVTPSPPSGE